MILLYVNVNFTVQNIGDYKDVIKCQSCVSVQEKLSKEDMPEERASSLASPLVFVSASGFDFSVS